MTVATPTALNAAGLEARVRLGLERRLLALMPAMVHSDVTAQLRTQRELAESEALYRGLVEHQSELVSLAHPDGQLKYVNRAYAAFYGQEPDGMVGRNLFEFVPKQEHAALLEHLRQVAATKQSATSENQVTLPNGEQRWLAWTNRALTDSDGRVTTIHSVGRDIDERVLAEQRLRESQARYRLLADNSADLIMLVGRDGQRFYVSPACERMLGFTPEEMLALNARDAIHPEDAERVLAILGTDEQMLANPTISYRTRRKDGSYLWVETTGRPVDHQAPTDQRLVVVRDIEQRRQMELRLKESEIRYRMLADNSSDMVFQLDSELVRRYVSPACRELLGYEPEQMIGVKPVAMTHPDDAERLGLVLKGLLNGDATCQSIVNRIRHRDGSWIWVEARFRALTSMEGGAPTGIIGALRDISARKAVEDDLAEANGRLQILAEQDGLTGLANRRVFDETLAREHLRATRDNTPLALILIDVDYFKNFNDGYGHPAGDDCLRRVALAVAQSIRRPADLAARYGGEEFAVLLPNADADGAMLIGERIRQAILRLGIPHVASAHGLVTVSAGVACVPRDAAETPGRFLQNADRALYSAKDSGRNAVLRATAAVPVAESSAAAAVLIES